MTGIKSRLALAGLATVAMLAFFAPVAAADPVGVIYGETDVECDPICIIEADGELEVNYQTWGYNFPCSDESATFKGKVDATGNLTDGEFDFECQNGWGDLYGPCAGEKMTGAVEYDGIVEQFTLDLENVCLSMGYFGTNYGSAAVDMNVTSEGELTTFSIEDQAIDSEIAPMGARIAGSFDLSPSVLYVIPQ